MRSSHDFWKNCPRGPITWLAAWQLCFCWVFAYSANNSILDQDWKMNNSILEFFELLIIQSWSWRKFKIQYWYFVPPNKPILQFVIRIQRMILTMYIRVHLTDKEEFAICVKSVLFGFKKLQDWIIRNSKNSKIELFFFLKNSKIELFALYSSKRTVTLPQQISLYNAL